MQATIFLKSESELIFPLVTAVGAHPVTPEGLIRLSGEPHSTSATPTVSSRDKRRRAVATYSTNAREQRQRILYSSSRSSMKSSISATWFHFSQHISFSGSLSCPRREGLRGPGGGAGARPGTLEPGARQRRHRKQLRGYRKGRGGGGVTPKAARASSSPVFKGSLLARASSSPGSSDSEELSTSPGQPGFRCLPRQVRRAPRGAPRAAPACGRRGVGVAGRGAERRAGPLAPASALPRQAAELLPHRCPAGSRRPASSPLPELPAAFLVRLGVSPAW